MQNKISSPIRAQVKLPSLAPSFYTPFFDKKPAFSVFKSRNRREYHKKSDKGSIVPYFKDKMLTLQDLEKHPKHIQDYYQFELGKGLTANTVIHRHANIRKCLQYAFQIGLIKSNPADRVERPRKDKYLATIYNQQELETLFKTVKGDPIELGVILAAFYGLRRSEVVGLKWDAIDFEKRQSA